jgi:ATP-dependent DNA helicase Rep
VADSKWQNVRDFRDWIAGVGDKEQQTLAEMAQRIALITMLGQRERDTDAVRLSTIHAAKGLEFAHVFLIGAEQGLLPHAGRIEAEADQDERSSPLDDPAVRLAEERRLMYVAITRARRSLAISWCRQRRRARATVDREPSPFIAEMGLEPDAGPSAVLDQAAGKERLAALRAMLARS